MENISSYLSGNSYPGRGILIGSTPDGKQAVIAYFIMGRSVNSCNRVFAPTDDGIRTEAFDPSKLSDPSLVIYAPVRTLGTDTIVTNGDQTDTIFDFMADGKSFEDALRTRCFEPDGPSWTPRISGIVSVAGGGFSYKLSILKSDDGRGEACLRFFYEYASPIPGEGHIIHTYFEDGNPLPSFVGEPVCVGIGDKIDSFTDTLWHSLNEEKKVSLFVRYIDLATGTSDTRIVNKNVK